MSSASKMDPPATTQDHNSQPKLSTGAAQAPTTTEAPPSTTTAGASFNTETNLLSADLDSAHLDSQNNLQHFPLQGNLPAHLNLLPLLPQDGGVYSADVLMNMPMMMPMMMDTNGALPGVPQSSISAGKSCFSPSASRVDSHVCAQTKLPYMIAKSDSGACKLSKRYGTPTCCSSA